MRICLLSTDYYSRARATDPHCATAAAYQYRLAHGLNELRHDIEVVTLPSTADTVSGATADLTGIGERKSNSTETPKESQELMVYKCVYPNTFDDLNMLLWATPTLHKTLKESFALWQTVLARHLEEPFDVIHLPERLGTGILPALAKLAAVVVTVPTSIAQTATAQTQAIKKKPPRTASDELIVKMFERLCIVTADALCSVNGTSASLLVAELDLEPESIEIIQQNIVQESDEIDARNLAEQMIGLYQSAIGNRASQLAQAPSYRLYLKDPRELLAQALTLTIAFDKMIYDYLFQYSFRFRFDHWRRKAAKDPKRFAHKVLLRVIRPLARIHPKLQVLAEQSK